MINIIELRQQLIEELNTLEKAKQLLLQCKKLTLNIMLSENVPAKKAEYSQKLAEKQQEYNDLMLNFYFFQK